ncbi:hypothetical protein C8J57DRAFT_1729099, partial [Mycena rebaudengoi]
MALDCLHEICSYLHPRELLVFPRLCKTKAWLSAQTPCPLYLSLPAPNRESRIRWLLDACRRLVRSQPTGSYASATAKTAHNLGRTRILDVRSFNELVPDAKLECLIPVKREKRKTHGQSPKVLFHFLEADLDIVTGSRPRLGRTFRFYEKQLQSIMHGPRPSVASNQLEDEEFAAHELANVAEPLRDSVWTAIRLELLLVLKRTKWDFFLLELDRTAGNVVRKIVDAAGMDPTTTTWAQMDDLEVRYRLFGLPFFRWVQSFDAQGRWRRVAGGRCGLPDGAGLGEGFLFAAISCFVLFLFASICTWGNVS